MSEHENFILNSEHDLINHKKLIHKYFGSLKIIEYDDMFSGNSFSPSTINLISDLLGSCDNSELLPIYQKSVTLPPHKSIINYQAVYQFLKKSGHIKWLNKHNRPFIKRVFDYLGVNTIRLI